MIKEKEVIMMTIMMMIMMMICGPSWAGLPSYAVEEDINVDDGGGGDDDDDEDNDDDDDEKTR